MKKDLRKCKKYAEKEFIRLQQQAPQISNETSNDDDDDDDEKKPKKETKRTVISLIKEKWEEMGYASLGRTENHLRDQLRSINEAIARRQDLLGMFNRYYYFL